MALHPPALLDQSILFAQKPTKLNFWNILILKQYIHKVLDMLKTVFGPLTLYILRLTTLQAL